MVASIPIIRNFESLRKQLNAAFASIFSSQNTFADVQTFPAGGIVIGTTKILAGSGTPEGAVAAPVSSLFLRTDGGATTTLYVKTSGGTGNTGWTAK